MTDNEIIKALKHWVKAYNRGCIIAANALDLINRQKAEIDKLNKFKSYFDDLYGKGLAVANWHLNGETEPFDNFYESALQEITEGENG